MSDMTIAEALSQVQDIAQNGQQVEGQPFLVRKGHITVYIGALELGLKPCSYCHSATSVGTIIVTHDDGRRIAFDAALYHYARAGHPMAETLTESLVAIISDM